MFIVYFNLVLSQISLNNNLIHAVGYNKNMYFYGVGNVLVMSLVTLHCRDFFHFRIVVSAKKGYEYRNISN